MVFAVAGQDGAEGFGARFDDARSNQGISDMGSADRRIFAGDGKDRVHVHGVVLSEAVDDEVRAIEPGPTSLFDDRGQTGVIGVMQVGQQVHADSLVPTRDLHPRTRPRP